MIKYEFQNKEQNDIWRFIIAFCMTQPEGTSVEALQYMLAKQLGIQADKTSIALANIRFQEDSMEDKITFREVVECLIAAAILGPLMIWIGVANVGYQRSKIL